MWDGPRMSANDATGELTFDQLVGLMESWIGSEVNVSCHGPEERTSSTMLFARGVLAAPGDADEIQLIDPPSGRVVAFRVGAGGVVLHEGDYVDADVDDSSIWANFNEVTVTITHQDSLPR